MTESGKRKAWHGVVAVISLATLAACGSAHKSSNAAGSHTNPHALEFANCMRAHGVPNFPDPTGAGGGVNLAGTGIDPQSPSFKAAQRLCAKLAPGRPGGPHATESQFIAALKFAKCMRLHGFPQFPDPTRFDAPPGPILVIGAGLYFHVSTSFDPNTPQVNRAVAACGGH
jgi:hypothetical protein